MTLQMFDDEETGRALVPAGDDPYSAYGARMAQQQGTFLSFNRGEFLYGKENKELPLGTQMIANMPGLKVGWRKWVGGAPDQDLTELLTETHKNPGLIQRRSQLGDTDEKLWEWDKEGKTQRDPWQFTNTLQLRNVADGEMYIFSTGSRGGIQAIADLCKNYGDLRRQRPDQLPIVELGKDFYIHATYGKTYFPVFEIVGWEGSEPEPAVAAPPPASEPPAGAVGAEVPAGPPREPAPATAASRLSNQRRPTRF